MYILMWHKIHNATLPVKILRLFPCSIFLPISEGCVRSHWRVIIIIGRSGYRVRRSCLASDASYNLRHVLLFRCWNFNDNSFFLKHTVQEKTGIWDHFIWGLIVRCIVFLALAEHPSPLHNQWVIKLLFHVRNATLVVIGWDAWHEICQARATLITLRPRVIWVALAWQISCHTSHHNDN